MDEQNLHRDKAGIGANSGFSVKEDPALPRTQNCRQGYERALNILDSPLAKLISSQKMYEMICNTCGDTSLTSDMFDPAIYLGIDPNDGPRQSLYSLLDNSCQAALREGLDCEPEGVYKMRDKTHRMLFSNLPDYLFFPLKVSQHGTRLNVRIDFPEVLDMGKYTWLSEKDEYSERVLPKQRPPFLYDCYAVIQHTGTVTSGHYWTLVRRVDRNNRWTKEWHEMNDSRVIPGRSFGDTQSSQTVMILYRRQGAA